MEVNFAPIEESYLKTDGYVSVIERYYTPRYYLNLLEPGDDYCVYMHSNKVCVVTLAPSHNLLKNEDTIESVNFQISEDILNKVSGKKKRGAYQIQPSSTILNVKCSDRSYKLCASVCGKLLEVNKQLIDNPNYLLVEPHGKGYLAIILPIFSAFDHIKDHLTTPEQYHELRQT